MKDPILVMRCLKRTLISISVCITAMMPYECYSQDTRLDELLSKEKRLKDWEEPRHQLVFSRDGIKMMDIRIPPGDTTDFHLHQHPSIGVIINPVSVQKQKYGEDWSAPTPNLSPQSRAWLKGYITGAEKQLEIRENYHRVRNSDVETFHYVAIISTRKPKETGSDAFQEHENYWFRAKKVIVEAKQESTKQQFPNDVVVVQYLKGESDILENHVAHSTKTEPGAFSWHQKNTAFTIRNKSEGSLGFVLVEIK
jgi:hypothetical protein